MDVKKKKNRARHAVRLVQVQVLTVVEMVTWYITHCFTEKVNDETSCQKGKTES